MGSLYDKGEPHELESNSSEATGAKRGFIGQKSTLKLK
jgi:hypothetical protein